jgi:hypothetical protein
MTMVTAVGTLERSLARGRAERAGPLQLVPKPSLDVLVVSLAFLDANIHVVHTPHVP